MIDMNWQVLVVWLVVGIVVIALIGRRFLKKRGLLLLATLLPFAAFGQSLEPDTKLARQLEESRGLKVTMKPDLEDAAQTRWFAKEVSRSRVLPLAEDFNSLRIKGPGTLSLDRERSVSGTGSVRLETPTSLGIKNPTNRNYALAEVVRPLDGEDLRGYNRFSVWVYVEAPGMYTVFGGFSLYNEGQHIMPAPGRFEGQHFETIYPGRWQRVVWEIPDQYRDRVTGFGVNIMLSGSPAGAAERMSIWVDDMRIETVEADNTRGFDLRRGAIAFSHSGYKTGARKQALVQNVSDTHFTIRDTATGKVAFEGIGQRSKDGFVVLDFSELDTPGRYTIEASGIVSGEFPIGDTAYLSLAWKTLNYFYAERCGWDQPGIHQECHQDVFSVHPDGRTLSVSGGWHDAADLTQGVGNTAEGGIAMLEMAAAIKGKDKVLYERLLEEARWGLNWTMRTRFGDGYRHGGLVVSIWTKNIRGDKDDMQAQAGNNPDDNLLGASYCALAAPFYEEFDPVFARWCRQSAIEDFGFAMELAGHTRSRKFQEVDFAGLVTVTAMRMYRLTGDQQYLDWAVQYADRIMACQQMEPRRDWSMPLRGFFWENSSHQRTRTYYHRSEEQYMMQALGMLLADAPMHANAPKWRASCEAYADYLRATADVMGPWGILPSAIYEVDNTDYSTFSHEGDKSQGAPTMAEYNAQVRNGIQLSKTHFLRRFPVSYQFRGFHAITLSKARSAIILADVLSDESLRDIATRQMEYIVGFNPFAMSTIYGEGYDWSPLYGAYAGDVVGAVPVGIETFENEDSPYWPTQSNATYKEIWMLTGAKTLGLVAELFGYANGSPVTSNNAQTSTGVVAPGAELQLLADGFEFTEGPATDARGNIFFTDQPNDRILEWDASKDELRTFLSGTGRANGLYFDLRGNLLAAADDLNEIRSFSRDGSFSVLARGFEGGEFNGPNDLWVNPLSGGIYFTDPLYARPYWRHRDDKIQLTGEHVYYISPDRSRVQRVETELKKPNGIVGTPDGKTLYIADIGENKTYSYDIAPDGTLYGKQFFCPLGSDGMTIDAAGNLYLTGRGVTVFNPRGEQIDHIDVPESWTANVVLGGSDRKILFITAMDSLYSIKIK